MALETGTYIADLVATNPVAGDQKTYGDDHLRLLKKTIKNTFAGFAGAAVVTGTDGGLVNAYTLTPATALGAYGTNMLAVFSPIATTTGTAPTLNISALGDKNIKNVDGGALLVGDLVLGSVYVALYNGSEFRLIGPTHNYIDSLSFSSSLPAQAGNSGKFVTTDGSSASWASAVTETATQTLTNKTIAAGVFTNGYTEESTAANTGTTYTVDLANGTVFILTLTGNCVYTFPTPTAGKSFLLIQIQDGTGGRSATWPSSVMWPGSVNPVITRTIAKADIFAFTGDGTYWYGRTIGQNYL